MKSTVTILAGALAALAVHGGVFDDAVIWYRGGYDANGGSGVWTRTLPLR